MSNYCMIETAFGDKREVKQVVNELLNNKLVASVKLLKAVVNGDGKTK